MKTKNSYVNSFYSEKFDSIQALRGIAALFVIFEHIRFLNCGAFGVDVFFCISGFMILFSTHSAPRHFLARRFIRILPFYWLMTLATYGLVCLFPEMFQQTAANPVFLFKSLFFLPFDIGNGAIQPLLRIGWTINCEIFFYLLFALSMRISHKYRGLLCSGLLLGMTVLAALWPDAPTFVLFYGNPVMLDFIFGMAAHGICRRLYTLYHAKRLHTVCLPVSCCLPVLLFAVLALTRQGINVAGFRRPLLWGLPALLLFLCFFTAGLFRKPPKVLSGLGNISFSLYLLHYYPILFLDRMLFDFSAPPSLMAVLGAAAGIALSIFAALIGYRLIEKRLTARLLKKLLKKT